MDHARVGSSGLRVSRIGLGCMSFGDPRLGTHPWTLSATESDNLIACAIDHGITFLDTANIYSLGTSEQIVGKALKRTGRRHDFVLSTKVFEKMDDTPLSGGLSRRAIFHEIDQSLARLETDHIDLYVIHRWDYQTPIEETLSALHDLIRMGKVRYIGASSMHTWQFVKAQYIADHFGLTRFVSMQSHYNLINREQEREMLPFCLAEGIGVTPWSPLARGKLANIDGPKTQRANDDMVQGWLYNSAPQSDQKIISALKSVAQDRSLPAAQVALAWLLNRPGITAPIVGATSISHLEEAAAATEIRLDPEEIKRLEMHYVPHEAPEYR
ncbi:alcohol dehydrogenase [Burkholderia sp. WAC0059]|uniref:aldo/keto reductase n=1 Tax=Burkholderia sp. WAC0059 TaxID=2066022 RepID=UPI000C7F6ECA|nr:aldo/keto reductase [Burkholderia sp. WAC0059]PLZ01782.1 alcohol dehydrogenase [Burkholderia sp. WAC0059]